MHYKLVPMHLISSFLYVYNIRVQYLGMDGLMPYLMELRKLRVAEFISKTCTQRNRTGLYMLANETNKKYATPEAVDLVDKLLR